MEIRAREGKRASLDAKTVEKPRSRQADSTTFVRASLETEPVSSKAKHPRIQVIAKRAFDLAVSTLALALLAPFMLLIATAIRLDSKGPAVFRQPRVGRGGRVFEMLKFRTMEVGADDRREELRHLNENDGILFKSTRDPRVTRVGRLLRPVSIDELPQLLQVLTGTMSLVGPRPMPPDMDVLIDERNRDRLSMRPGVTGVWQIDTTERRRSIQEMAKLDHQYVETWSLWGDLKLFVATVPYVLLRRGV